MAKRKITITVDEELVEWLRSGDEAVSAVINSALREHYEREAHHRALAELLARWEAEQGPIPDEARTAARAAFDELDGIAAAVAS